MPKHNTALNDELRGLLRQLTHSGRLPNNYASIVADQLNRKTRVSPITPNQVSQVGTGKSGKLEIAEAIVTLAEEDKVRQLIERIRRILAEVEEEGEWVWVDYPHVSKTLEVLETYRRIFTRLSFLPISRLLYLIV